MGFTIYPAIDLRGGKCVRLYQGDFNQESIYHDSPVEVAKAFYNQGAQWLHIVDLDGAKSGIPQNHQLIQQIAREVPINIEVGGGIRTHESIKEYLSNGIQRVILGTTIIREPEIVKQALELYKEQIVIGLDTREGKIAGDGWLTTSELDAVTIGKKLIEQGAKTFIYTDIAKDGALSGPNIEAIASFAKETGADVIASGGVSTLGDLKDLAAFNKKGIQGVIIGKALYNGLFTVSDALDVADSYAD